MAALIPSTRHVVQVAGAVFTDVPNLIVLGTYVSSNQYGTARVFNTNTGYQITAGKTFRALAMRLTTLVTGNIGASPGYGDNDVGVNSAAAPTNQRPAIADGNFYVLQGAGNSARENNFETAFKMDMPAAKYPFFNTNSTAMSLYMYGYEV